jgi:hypothetical protein
LGWCRPTESACRLWQAATNRPETEDSFEDRYRLMTPEQREADARALFAVIKRRLAQPDALKLLAGESTEVEAEDDN